jgi:hypothetical protein
MKDLGERLDNVGVMLAHQSNQHILEMIRFLRQIDGPRVSSNEGHALRLNVKNGRGPVHEIVTCGSDEDAAGGVERMSDGRPMDRHLRIGHFTDQGIDRLCRSLSQDSVLGLGYDGGQQRTLGNEGRQS